MPADTARTAAPAAALATAQPGAPSLPVSSMTTSAAPDGAPPPSAGPARGLCPHCNPEEQLVVDLNYYQQLLTIIGAINQQQSTIEPAMLQAFNRLLLELRPGLAKLLVSPKPPPSPPGGKAAQSRPAAPAAARKSTARTPRPPRKQGIEGIRVGHVQAANPAWGTAAVVVLTLNGRPRSLNAGSSFRHNRRAWKIIKTEYRSDTRAGSYHEVHLRDETSKKVHILPWQ